MIGTSQEVLMPISDLFKKSPKKQPAQENPLGSSEMQKKSYDTAMDFIKVFQERMPLVGGKPHAGTVLSVAGRDKSVPFDQQAGHQTQYRRPL